MAGTDWAADVKKYEPDADDLVIAGIVRHCGIALRSRDASLVSFNDPLETGRVRESFLRKKLGLTDPDETLDAAIAAVGERMSDTSFRNRVTVYYLLAAHFGKLDLFRTGRAAGEPETTEETAPEPDSETAPAADEPPMLAAMTAPEAPAPAPRPAAVAPPRPRPGPQGGLVLPLAVLLLGGVGLAAYIGSGGRSRLPAAAPAAPMGAAVVQQMVDGKPFVSVYFDTASTALHPDFEAAAAVMAAHVASNPGARLGISGFADPRGSAAFNAELARNRAEAVRAALAARGLPEDALVLVKPPAITDPSLALAYGRRVDIAVL